MGGWVFCFRVGGIWITANEWTACHITSELKTVWAVLDASITSVKAWNSQRIVKRSWEKKERALQSCDSLTHFTRSLTSRLDKVL